MTQVSRYQQADVSKYSSYEFKENVYHNQGVYADAQDKMISRQVKKTEKDISFLVSKYFNLVEKRELSDRANIQNNAKARLAMMQEKAKAKTNNQAKTIATNTL